MTSKELMCSLPADTVSLPADTVSLLDRLREMHNVGIAALHRLERTTEIAECAAEKAAQADTLSTLAMNQACSAANASTVANHTANRAHEVAAEACTVAAETQQAVAGVAQGQEFLAQELEALRQKIETISVRPSTSAQPRPKPQQLDVCPHGGRCNQPHCIHRGGHGTEADRVMNFMHSLRIPLVSDGRGGFNGICACGSTFQLSAKGQWHTKCKKDCQGAHH